MASKLDSRKPKDTDGEIPTKKMKATEKNDDLSLEIVFQGFKALPVYKDVRKLTDLPEFLIRHGRHITKLNYTEDAGEENRKLILIHCTNINDASFEFTEHPEHPFDNEKTELLVKFLSDLAPRLTRLETINNVAVFHHSACMSSVYGNLSDKIRFLKTDELRPEELSALSGHIDKVNPASLSLEELIYCDNDLPSARSRLAPSTLALRPESLTKLAKLTNLRRINLPFYIIREKLSPVAALPLLDYASIKLMSHNRGKVAASPFTENIGKALANVRELQLSNDDRGLLVLTSVLTSCTRLEKLNLSDYDVKAKFEMGLTTLAGMKYQFKQLDDSMPKTSNKLDVLLCLIRNTPTLQSINISGIEDKKDLQTICSATIPLCGTFEHNVALNFTLNYSDPQMPPYEAPNSLNVTLHIGD